MGEFCEWSWEREFCNRLLNPTAGWGVRRNQYFLGVESCLENSCSGGTNRIFFVAIISCYKINLGLQISKKISRQHSLVHGCKPMALSEPF